MGNVRRTDADLVVFSERLLHDAQVFFHVSRALVRIAKTLEPTPPWEVETALVESFALHARALVDFLFARKRTAYPDDAFAIDFFDSPNQWLEVLPDQGRWLTAIRRRKTKDGGSHVDRFAEELGHLNYIEAPLSAYARGWPTVQISRDLGVVLYSFVCAVDSQRVSNDFKIKARREIPVAAKLGTARQALAIWSPPAIPRRLGAS